jgi:hypothetical protein
VALTISAVARSVTTSGQPWLMVIGAYNIRSVFSASVELTPITIRSGVRVSATAVPSRRNSGFQATSTASAAGARRRARSSTVRAVPGDTVDLPTMRQGRFRCGASSSTAAVSWDRS